MKPVRLVVLVAAGALLLVGAAPAAQPLATSVAAGYYHSCALLAGNAVKCWGSNERAQIADGTTKNRLTAVPSAGLSGTIQNLVAGGAHTCALTSDGDVECWGDDQYGQLGTGTIAPHLPPQPVKGLSSGVTALALGAIHSCALVGGAVECWGDNRFGQLGDGTTTSRTQPVTVSGLGSGVQAVAAGAFHTCALVSGAVECWGYNEFGQLGDGTDSNQLTPVHVAGLSGVTGIAAGGAHTCALVSGGGMKCWGDNEYGQLGNDEESTSEPTPVAVTDLPPDVRTIVAGFTDTCALTRSANVWCWGNLFEEAPEQIDRLGGAATAIALNGGDTYDDHACAAMASGGVKCWGSDDNGELGNGRTESLEFTPSFVLGLAGGVHILIVRVAGKGTVRGAGIRCAEQCGYERPEGKRVVLTVRAAKRYRFKRWSGACHGRRHRCTIILSGDTTVAAHFVKRRRK